MGWHATTWACAWLGFRMVHGFHVLSCFLSRTVNSISSVHRACCKGKAVQFCPNHLLKMVPFGSNFNTYAQDMANINSKLLLGTLLDHHPPKKLVVLPKEIEIDAFDVQPLTLDETQQLKSVSSPQVVMLGVHTSCNWSLAAWMAPATWSVSWGDASWRLLVERGANLALLHPLQPIFAVNLFFVVSEYRNFHQKKKHPPEFDWIYWKGKFLDPLFAVAFLRWRHQSGIRPHHSSRCDRSMFHRFTQP